LNGTIRETEPHHEHWIGVDEVEHLYRSVVGRAASADRRLDVSVSSPCTVLFFRLREGRGGMEQTPVGAFVLDEGVPLIWPVPEHSRIEDVLVRVMRLDDELGPEERNPVRVFIGDHWATS
jgi:hypothetical protein